MSRWYEYRWSFSHFYDALFRWYAKYKLTLDAKLSEVKTAEELFMDRDRRKELTCSDGVALKEAFFIW